MVWLVWLMGLGWLVWLVTCENKDAAMVRAMMMKMMR